MHSLTLTDLDDSLTIFDLLPSLRNFSALMEVNVAMFFAVMFSRHPTSDNNTFELCFSTPEIMDDLHFWQLALYTARIRLSLDADNIAIDQTEILIEDVSHDTAILKKGTAKVVLKKVLRPQDQPLYCSEIPD